MCIFNKWNIKYKRNEKRKSKKKEIYAFKQGSLEGYPQFRKVLENKVISELAYI